jgi:hypothetical protein
VSGLPPTRRMERDGRSDEAGELPRGELLGPAASRLRRSGGASVDRWSCAGCSWWKPDGPDLHRGPLRRLALCVVASHGVGESAVLRGAGGRTSARGRLYHRGGPLRAAGEQTHDRRARSLPSLSRTGVDASHTRVRDRRARELCMARRARGVRGGWRASHSAPAPVRTRGRGDPGTFLPAGLVSPESAEHVHRQAHGGDAGRHLQRGARGRRETGWACEQRQRRLGGRDCDRGCVVRRSV